MNVTFGGNPLTLKGTQLKAGDKLPDFTVTANDLSPFKLADTKGIRVFLTVPSLDTPVCDLEAKTFNKKAAELPGVSIYVISVDLPFAQGRWCAGAGVDAVKTLSDYHLHSFADATGTYINELGLLTRAVFIVDGAGKVVWAQYVPEVTEQPDFETIYAKLKELA